MDDCDLGTDVPGHVFYGTWGQFVCKTDKLSPYLPTSLSPYHLKRSFFFV